MRGTQVKHKKAILDSVLSWPWQEAQMHQQVFKKDQGCKIQKDCCGTSAHAMQLCITICFLCNYGASPVWLAGHRPFFLTCWHRPFL